MAVDIGHGTAIAFGTSTFTAGCLRISGGEQTRDAVDASYLATSGFSEFIPADLQDAGSATVDFLFQKTLDYPLISAAAETVTITFPGGGTLAGTAFVTNFKWPECSSNEMMEGAVTVKWDGYTGPTWTKSA